MIGDLKAPMFGVAGAAIACLVGCSPPKTASQAEKQAAFNGIEKELQIQLNLCDAYTKSLADATSAGRQAFYEAASSAQSQCSSAQVSIEAIAVPDALYPHQEEFSNALKDIGLAVFARSEGFGKLAAAIDSGDVRPSVISDVQEQTSFYARELLKGIGELQDAAKGAGVNTDPSALADPDAKPTR